ncbi:hypothetical protein C8R45DRAFT_638684 [Mycena sanguinolenta]|nr:hypothetical protein C8R45DRAFT_638684 [Mycena sanguinolenta]
MYQGNGAEEEWRQEIAKYMSLRHPNIVQICGAASSGGIHAMLFNDDLIPLQEILDRHRGSPFSTVYIYARCDFTEAVKYLSSVFERAFLSENCTSWIRRSTGQLCTELIPGSGNLHLDWESPESPALSGIYSLSLGTENITTFIDLLTLEQYHRICDWNLGRLRRFSLSAFTTANLGVVFRCSGHQLEDSVEIAFLPSAEALHFGDWKTFEGVTSEVMPDGWTRFQSGAVFNNTLSIFFSIYTNWETWLSQANHIFRRLHIMSNFDD